MIIIIVTVIVIIISIIGGMDDHHHTFINLSQNQKQSISHTICNESALCRVDALRYLTTLL